MHSSCTVLSKTTSQEKFMPTMGYSVDCIQFWLLAKLAASELMYVAHNSFEMVGQHFQVTVHTRATSLAVIQVKYSVKK